MLILLSTLLVAITNTVFPDTTPHHPSDHSATFPFLALPFELIDHVFTFLDLRTRLNVTCTSKALRQHFLRSSNGAWVVLDATPVRCEARLRGLERFLAEGLSPMTRTLVRVLVVDADGFFHGYPTVNLFVETALRLLPNLEVLSARGYDLQLIHTAFIALKQSGRPLLKLRRVNIATFLCSSACTAHELRQSLPSSTDSPALDIRDCTAQHSPRRWHIPASRCLGCDRFPPGCRQCASPNNLYVCQRCTYRVVCADCRGLFVWCPPLACVCGAALGEPMHVCRACSEEIWHARDRYRYARCYCVAEGRGEGLYRAVELCQAFV